VLKNWIELSFAHTKKQTPKKKQKKNNKQTNKHAFYTQIKTMLISKEILHQKSRYCIPI
jgi:hypothetical protein